MDAESQSSAAALTLSNGLSRPLNAQEIELLTQLDRLKHFLATAPSRWTNTSNSASHLNGSASTSQQQTLNAQLQPVVPSNHPALNRFLLPSSEYVSCVLWSGLYHITGTDIVRALVFRFEAFGRPVINMKKFEEGVFSDLRNLKPGTDACLEEPKSPFLDLLFKYQCIRTQKKQKVFYWFSVPHDRLFLDALERDLKREKMGLEPTTVPRGEPAISFKYDPKRTLYEQYLKPANSENGNGDDEDVDELQSPVNAFASSRGPGGVKNNISVISPADIMARRVQATLKQEDTSNFLPLSSNTHASSSASSASAVAHKTFLHMFSLFEGSPTYKQRRKKAGSNAKHPSSTNAAAIEKVDMARRKSVLAGESLMRRNSTLSGIPEMSQGLHPSLVGPTGYPRMDQTGSRPQSAHQPLPSYGLSMNLPVTSDREDHHERPGSQHQSIQLSNPSHSVQHQETTRAYRCPLYSCGALFRRSEELKKHLPNHGMSALIRSRAASNATNGSDGHGNVGGGLKYPCDRGCGKVFSRADLLRIHQSACTGASSGWMNGNVHPNTGEELDELADDNMDIEAEIQEVEVPVNSRFEDDLPSSGSVSPPNPPGSSHGSTSTFQQQQERYYLSGSNADPQQQQQQQAYDTGYGRGRGHHLPPVLTPKFNVATSAETSPYVETPEGGGAAQWASIPAHPSHHALAGQHSLDNHHQHPSAGHHGHVLNHHMSHHNLGTIQSPPGSAHSTHSLAGRSVFGQQQLHPATRYQSPEFNLYTGYPHPSSAPSHKATFDQASLHPPTYHQNGGMVGLSLRRHRSAAPMMGSGGAGSLLHQRHDQPRTQHSHIDSRPASSAGGESNYEYGNVIVNPPGAHPFAYSVDSGDGRGAVGYMPPGSAGGPIAAVTGPASDHSSPLSYGQVAIGPNGEYADSNSPYESGGSPGSVGHGQILPQSVPVPVPMPLSQPPMLPIAPMGYGMRGHMHSLSSEVAAQQMQQYVDFDGGAEESHQQNGSSNGHDGAYLQQQSVAPAPYRGNGSEGGNHEEVYQQYHYQHPPPMHLQHQYGYGAPVEQQVAL